MEQDEIDVNKLEIDNNNKRKPSPVCVGHSEVLDLQVQFKKVRVRRIKALRDQVQDVMEELLKTSCNYCDNTWGLKNEVL